MSLSSAKRVPAWSSLNALNGQPAPCITQRPQSIVLLICTLAARGLSYAYNAPRLQSRQHMIHQYTSNCKSRGSF